MRRQIWLIIALFGVFLVGCTAQPPVPPSPAGLMSAVPTDSFDRADLPCYFGAVW